MTTMQYLWKACYIVTSCKYLQGHYCVSVSQVLLHKTFHSQDRRSCPFSNQQHTTRKIVISKGYCVDGDTRDLIFKPVIQRNQKVRQLHPPQGLGIQCLTQGPDSSLSLGPLIKQQSLAAPGATLLLPPLLWKVQCDPVKTATRVKQQPLRQHWWTCARRLEMC